MAGTSDRSQMTMEQLLTERFCQIQLGPPRVQGGEGRMRTRTTRSKGAAGYPSLSYNEMKVYVDLSKEEVDGLFDGPDRPMSAAERSLLTATRPYPPLSPEFAEFGPRPENKFTVRYLHSVYKMFDAAIGPMVQHAFERPKGEWAAPFGPAPDGTDRPYKLMARTGERTTTEMPARNADPISADFTWRFGDEVDAPAVVGLFKRATSIVPDQWTQTSTTRGVENRQILGSEASALAHRFACPTVVIFDGMHAVILYFPSQDGSLGYLLNSAPPKPVEALLLPADAPLLRYALFRAAFRGFQFCQAVLAKQDPVTARGSWSRKLDWDTPGLTEWRLPILKTTYTPHMEEENTTDHPKMFPFRLFFHYATGRWRWAEQRKDGSLVCHHGF